MGMVRAFYTSQIKPQLERSARLRIAIWLILLLSLVYGALLVRDWRLQSEVVLRDTQGRLSHVKAVSAQSEWPERELAAVEQMNRLLARLWQAGTRGIAQATLQSWIDSRFAEVGIKVNRSETLISDEPDQKSGLYVANARVSGIYEPAAMQQLLTRLTNEDRAIVVERLELRVNDGGGVFEMAIRTYFSIDESKKGQVE